ncbi:MAG: flagellar filament capping protein FliD, partial [Myxococcota bacterium]
RGNDTGDANQVVFNETGTVDLGLDEPSNTYQNAQDAQITIDDQGPSGFGGFVIERSTNQFREVIPGITFTATEVTTSDLQVEIAPDFDQQADKIQSFIDAYNAAISSGRRSAGFGTVNAVNRNLQSDSSIRTALDRLGRTVSSPVDGLTGRYNQLAAVGVELTREGDLSLDRSTLEEALAADPDAVAKVFAGDPNNGIDGIMTTLIGVVESLAEGDDSVLETRIDAFDARIDRLAEDELTLARRLEDFETRLRREFTDLEILISQINEQAAGLAGLSNTVPQASSNNNS